MTTLNSYLKLATGDYLLLTDGASRLLLASGGAELINLRNRRQSSRIYLSVLQPDTLLTALVNNGSIARGDRSIAYDTGTGSGFGDIEEGQLLEIDTQDSVTKIVRVKSITGSQASGTITIDENAINWSNNDVLRIKHHYPVVPVPPRISSGVFYKFFDLAYSDQNEEPPPVCIAGPHQAGFLSGGILTLSVPIGDSYVTADGAAISSRSVTVTPSTGVTVNAFASGKIDIDYTAAGTYWVKSSVTDDNGKTQVTYRVHFAHDRTGDDAPYTNFTVQGLSGSWSSGGYRFSVVATGDVTLSDFPDGTIVVLWYENFYDGAEGYVNLWEDASSNKVGNQIICTGYIRSDNDQDNYDDGSGQVSFEVVTPQQLIDEMTDFGSVILQTNASPATWYQYATWLTVGRACHHELRWQSTVLMTMDIYGLLDNTLGMEQAKFTENSLLQRINGLADSRGHFARLVSDRMGRLHLVTDSQMLNTAARSALDTIFSVTNNDISGGVNIVRRQEAELATADLDGFSFDGATATPFISIAPGYIDTSVSFAMPEFRGTPGPKASNQVLNNQADSNEKCGRLLAVQNNPIREVRLTNPSNYLGAFDIVPSLGWNTIGWANADLKRALELNGDRILCRSLTHNVNVQSGIIQTSVVFETEAFGADGIPGNYPTSFPANPLPPDPVDLSAACSPSGWTVGTPVLYQSGSISFPMMTAFSTTEAFLTHFDGIDPPLIYGLVTVTAGVPAFSKKTTDSGDLTQGEICHIPTTSKALDVYFDDDTNNFYARIIEEGVSDITLNADTSMSAVAATARVGCTLSSTIGMAARRDSASVGRISLLTLGATTITEDDELTITSGGDDCQPMALIGVDGTRALLVYRLISDGLPYAVVFSHDGAGNLSRGTPSALSANAMTGTQQRRLGCLLDTDKVLVCYDATTGRNLTGQILTLSGSTITNNAEKVIDVLSSAVFEYSVDTFDTDKAMFFYTDTGGNSKVKEMTANGATIELCDTIPLGISASECHISAFDTDLIVLAYSNGINGYLLPLTI